MNIEKFTEICNKYQFEIYECSKTRTTNKLPLQNFWNELSFIIDENFPTFINMFRLPIIIQTNLCKLTFQDSGKDEDGWRIDVIIEPNEN